MSMETKLLEKFLKRENKIAIIGVSGNPKKWGYKIYKSLKSAGFNVYPINPKYTKINGDICYPNLRSVLKSGKVDVVITVVPPSVTEHIVEQCRELGIGRIWMQPGSESERAISLCKENGIDVIYNVCFVVDGLKNLMKSENVQDL